MKNIKSEYKNIKMRARIGKIEYNIMKKRRRVFRLLVFLCEPQMRWQSPGRPGEPLFYIPYLKIEGRDRIPKGTSREGSLPGNLH